MRIRLDLELLIQAYAGPCALELRFLDEIWKLGWRRNPSNFLAPQF
jgi:hypothetical protein